MKVAITGGAGMIGSNLAKRLVNRGDEVVIVDNFWRGREANLRDESGELTVPQRNILNRDLTSYDSCLESLANVDICFHLADVVAGINFVFANELFVWRQNMLINSNVLHACIENKVESFVYVGSACSYPKEAQAQLEPAPFTETDAYPAAPESSYGWSKLMGEYEAELAMSEGLIRVGILRLHNVYGSPAALDPSISQVIPALCRKGVMFPDEPFLVWGSGNQRRAFVHVDDVIDALELVLSRGMDQGVIQIGPSQSHSIGEIAKIIGEISGKDLVPEFDTSRPEGDRDRTADWTKARDILGWSPSIDINEGLRKTYAWCAQQLLQPDGGRAHIS